MGPRPESSSAMFERRVHALVVGVVVFSFGMTAILIAVGLFSGSLARLPRSGPWLIWVKRIAGAILIAAAEYYFIQMGMVY